MSKDFLRRKVWQTLQKRGVLRFPGRQGQVPNFVGAAQAAARLWQLPIWARTRRVLMIPASSQLLLRRRALAEGKVLFLVAPALRAEKCFIEVNPKRLGRRAFLCSSLAGAMKYGRHLPPTELPSIDLVVWGSIAVRRDGAQVGSGQGVADLVYAMLREEGRVRDRTPVVTTVHPLQVVNDRWAISAHDVAVDFIVTPSEVTATHSPHPRPRGFYWDLVSPQQLDAMPALRHRWRRSGFHLPQHV